MPDRLSDTTAEAKEVQLEILRKLGPERRSMLTAEWSDAMPWRMRRAFAIAAQLVVIAFFALLAWVGISILQVLATDTLVSLLRELEVMTLAKAFQGETPEHNRLGTDVEQIHDAAAADAFLKEQPAVAMLGIACVLTGEPGVRADIQGCALGRSDGHAAFVQGDLADTGALDVLFQTRPFDAVVHFAAFIEAGESMQLPGKYFLNNVSNTRNLLDAMVRHGVMRLIFSSSAGVYVSKDTPLVEDDPTGPASVYGETKLMMERMLGWYHQTVGVRFAALRYFNACGAMLDANGVPVRGEDHHPETHLIPLTLQVPLGQRDAIMIYGTDYNTPDGTCIRDYVHIDDLASAHVLALDALDAGEGSLIYNLGNGQGYSVREVINTVRRVSGRDFKVVEADRRPGDPAFLTSDATKIRRELGWTARKPELESMVATAWQWHNEHPNGYSD